MEFKVMVQGDGFLAGFGHKMDSDLNFELAPAAMTRQERARLRGVIEQTRFQKVQKVVCQYLFMFRMHSQVRSG